MNCLPHFDEIFFNLRGLDILILHAREKMKYKHLTIFMFNVQDEKGCLER